MPWKASQSLGDQRAEFFRKHYEEGIPISKLCREYGISRKAAYKWKTRYDRGEPLDDRSRRPKSSPGATPERVVAEIIKLREQHRFLGGHKISLILKRRGVENVPSGNTVTSILRNKDLLDKVAAKEARHYLRFRKDEANDMWQADFKGHFPLSDGRRCHTLNVLDDYSRFCICCEPLLGESFELVKPVFVKAFKEYGLPFSLLCDNGSPWGGAKEGRGISIFETWLMELGILTIHGKPMHPQTQGKEERFNKSFTREALRYADTTDLISAKLSFDEFRRFYNTERPHWSLNNQVPVDLYHPSARPYSDSIEEWDYSEESQIRTVSGPGQVAFGGKVTYLSAGLIGKRVAFIPSKRDGIFNIIFRNFLVAKYDQRENKMLFVRSYLLSNDPRPSYPGLD